jgi:pyrroloquinoline quinone biosynthesis protein D
MVSHASNKRPLLAKRARLHTDPVSGQPVLLHQEAILELNDSGYQILRLCDGAHTLTEIIRDMENRYPAATSILAQEVSDYIEAISRKGLIEWI